MRTLTLNSVLDKMYGVGQKRPFKVFLDLTHRCNFNCCHCYVKSDTVSKELTLKDYEGIATELEALGTLHVILTGGEVLVRPDFTEIYTLFKERGFWVTVMTNGHALDSSHFELFQKLPPKAVEISVYAMDQLPFADFTRTSNQAKRVHENIRKLAALEIPLYLKSVLTTDNQAQIDKMRSFAKELGLHFRYDVRFHPAIDGCNRCSDKQVELNDIKKIDSTHTNLLNEISQKHEERVAAVRASRLGHSGRFRCGIGRKSMVIDPVGFVYGCLIYRAHQWNLLDIPLSTIFNERLPSLRTEKRSFAIACDDCDFANECSFCEGILWLNHNNPECIREYCAITKNRLELAVGRI